MLYVFWSLRNPASEVGTAVPPLPAAMPPHEDYMLPTPNEKVSELLIKKIFTQIEKECTLSDFFNSLLVCRRDSNVWKHYAVKLAPFAPGILLAFADNEKVVIASAKVLSSCTKAKHPHLGTILEAVVPQALDCLGSVNWLVRWCFEKTNTALKKELVALSSEDFVKGNATRGKVQDIQDFNMGLLALRYKEMAPMNWELERSLMDATDSARRLRDQQRKEQTKGKAKERDGEAMPHLRDPVDRPNYESDDEEYYDSV